MFPVAVPPMPRIALPPSPDRDALRHCTPGRLWGGLVVPLATGSLARFSPFPDLALPRANAPVVTLPGVPMACTVAILFH